MLAYGYGTPAGLLRLRLDDPRRLPAGRRERLRHRHRLHERPWVCIDRNAGVRAHGRLAQLRRRAPVANWYDDGVNLIAFSRGDRGFFSTNNTTAAKTVTVRTGTAGPGTYCDVIHGTRRANGACTGPTVTVRAGGQATITVGSYDSVAFTARDRVS